MFVYFFFSSRRRHTRCALVTGVQTCALPISGIACYHPDNDVLSFREVRALIAWTRVALDENDRLALVLAMSTPDCGLTAAAIDMFVDMARDKGISLAQTLREAMTSGRATAGGRSEEHTSELQSLMRSSYAVFCLKKKNKKQ